MADADVEHRDAVRAGQQHVAGIEQRVRGQVEARRCRRHRSGALVDRRIRYDDRASGAAVGRCRERRDRQVAADLNRFREGVVGFVRLDDEVRGVGFRDQVIGACRRVGRQRHRQRRRVAGAGLELRDVVVGRQQAIPGIQHEVVREVVARC